MSRGSSADDAPVMLCNITEQNWILHRTHGTFFVAGCAPHASTNGKSAVNDDDAHGSVARVPRTRGLSADDASAPTVGDSANQTDNVSPSGNTINTPAFGERGLHERSDHAGESSDIPAAPLAPYALTPISARTGAIDLGDKRTLEFPISARDIAEDLAREINADGGESSYFGVFVCEGCEPTELELAEAREKLGVFYHSLVSVADKQWERTHNVAFISDLERRAARELRLEKDWSYEPQQRIDCPACGEKLKPGVAVCRICGAVLDRAKAAQYGLLAPTNAPSANTSA